MHLGLDLLLVVQSITAFVTIVLTCNQIFNDYKEVMVQNREKKMKGGNFELKIDSKQSLNKKKCNRKLRERKLEPT